MNTYWDEFLIEYKDKIIDMSLRQILEEFWYFCNKPRQPEKYND